jgi:methylmalonyl-CoA mutase
MNAIGSERVYMRSLATRRSHTEIPEAMTDIIQVAKAAGFDLIIAETAGIGQGDSQIVDLADVAMYVMTAEFGAASQLEKIDMLDFADIVVVNKFEKRGGEDAVRDVRKQVQRNRNAFEIPPEEMPVYGTIASKFNDDGVTALYHGLLDQIKAKPGWLSRPTCPGPEPGSLPPKPSSSPPSAPATWLKSPKPFATTMPAPTTRPRRCDGSGIWRKPPGSCRAICRMIPARPCSRN